jgi:translation initiation factor IF-1
LFKVELSPLNPDSEPGKQILAYLAGKMRLHRIRVLVGDKVEIVLDPYGGKGRIVRRL